MAIIFGSTHGSDPGGCGASLIASNWAITAAHCVIHDEFPPFTKESLSLVLGEFDISSSTDEYDGKRWDKSFF